MLRSDVGVVVMRLAFWEDHQAALVDPEYARAFAAESIRVSTIDTIMNALLAQVESSGLSKAGLARAIGANPAAVRRLLSAKDVNPTLGTLAELAGALGMKVTLAPLTPAERKTITEPMMQLAQRSDATAPTSKLTRERSTSPGHHAPERAARAAV